MTIAQSWNNESGASTVTSGTVTVSGATEGRLLIGGFALNGNSGAQATPTGWSLIQNVSTNADTTGAVYWRTATGDSNDNLALSWTNAEPYAALVVEYSDSIDNAAPVEDSTENGPTFGTSLGTGTATPTTNDGLFVAFALAGRGEGVTDADLEDPQIDSGFGDVLRFLGSDTQKPMVVFASTTYITAAGESATWSRSPSSSGFAYWYTGMIALTDPLGYGNNINGQTIQGKVNGVTASTIAKVNGV